MAQSATRCKACGGGPSRRGDRRQIRIAALPGRESGRDLWCGTERGCHDLFAGRSLVSEPKREKPHNISRSWPPAFTHRGLWATVCSKKQRFGATFLDPTALRDEDAERLANLTLGASNSFRVRWRGHHGAQDFGGSNKRTGSAPRAVGSELEKGTFVMKKVLYGTTALVAAGLAAGEASAASGLKLGITGFYRNAIGGSFGNGPTTQHPSRRGGGVSTAGLGNFDRQAVSMRQEIRVNFTGQTTLDNGITVGVLGRSERRKRRQVRQHHPGQPRLCRFQRQVRSGPRR